MKTILVTGVTGYIGSHTAVELLNSGYKVIGIDNLCNSKIESLNRVHLITGKTVTFYEGDVRDSSLLESIFANHKIDGIIHFAGLKSNAESIENPDLYYDVNLNSTRNLLVCMRKYGCKYIIFSGSATVYGSNPNVPLKENEARPDLILSPYGKTKYLNEVLLKEETYNNELFAISLRYFNPVGAHPSGLLGEDNGQQIPNCLFPYLLKVALKQLPYLKVFGNDYKTKDGTGVRDYIHVVDLAKGHIAALKYIEKMSNKFDVFNLGTGKGSTVLELINAFVEENKIPIPYRIEGRRAGDMPISFACVEKANNVLNWHTQFTIRDCVRDAWNFQSKNPNGY